MEIDEAEQTRFVDHLEKLLRGILALEEKRLADGGAAGRQTDSPVFTFLEKMAPPEYELVDQLEPPRYVPPEEREATQVDEGKSLANLITRAEAAKKAKDFPEAIRLFGEGVARGKDKPDLFLAQRLALVTYKNGEQKDEQGQVDKDAAIQALQEAEDILARYCAPRISTDPETLGLSGAINKRLFELTDDLLYLDRAIAFYERGFYVKQDYYNGINVAFMYTLRANLLPDDFDAIVSFGHGNMIRKQVAEICSELIEDGAAFQRRGDKQWVYMSLAEAYQGMGQDEDEARLATKIEAEADDFGKDSYQGQKAKLGAAIAQFDQRMAHSGLPGGQAGATSTEPASTRPKPSANPVVTYVNAPPAGVAGERRVLSIDADVARDRPIRSVDVSCRIEYE